ncbi:aromatic ring-hydroxylating dioxygenase subunit alpha [Hyphomonas sp.]|uniref:aromatic ring-hydroxylating oxygenase subunit alpha n=1 Tax=Hyphomonas sp. TaxID=87 RepID=UPI001BCD231D|nr:aromatic ring-hydroxylating dioxygenase subunit alpha [Hyphomonas sp.]
MADTHAAPKTGITADGFLTDSWYLAAPSAELKAGQHQRIMMLGEPVVVGRTPAGEAFALRDICPHRLVPLSAGEQVETDGQWTLQCPYHGWRFGTDGGCRLMPSLTEGSLYDPSKVKVRRYPVHEANGAVYVYVTHDARSTEPPAVPPPDFGPLPDKPKFVIHDLFNAHMDDAVVGLMDPAHVPFVHNQWWWRPPSAGLKLKQKPFIPTLRGWAIDRHAPSSNSKLYRWVFGGDVMTEIRFQLPGYRWEIISNATARLLTLTCLTPEAPKRTRITQFTWWTGAPLLNLAVPVAKHMGATFLAQDGRMVDLQNEGMAHQKAMLWIDDIDVQAKWYQMLKREWTAARSEGREFANPIEPRVLRWMS